MPANRRLLLASRDDALVDRLGPALAQRGFEVTVARTGLALVFTGTTTLARARHPGVVIDARASSLGVAPLLWLRDDPVFRGVIVLADPDDARALAAAEAAGAAAVLDVGAPERPTFDHAGLARDVARTLRGRGPRDALRWVPPVALPPRAGASTTSGAR